MRRILRRFFAADVSVATTTAMGMYGCRWQTTTSTTSGAVEGEEEEGTTPLASASLEEWLVMAQDRLHQLEMGHVASPPSSSTPTSSSPSISASSPLPSSSTQVTRQHINNNNNNNNNVAAVRQRQHTNALELISDLELLASSAPSVATLTASSLLLAGLDTKAVFSQGSNGFHDVSLHGKDFSRSDFTGIQLVNVCGLESSFARSTWYRVVLHDSCFVDCNLQGCILKHLTVRVSDGVLEQHDDEEEDQEEGDGQMRQTEPLIPFTRCDFRYAMIDLSQTAEDWIIQNHHTSGAAATTTRRGVAAPSSSTLSTPPPRVMFADCDFYMAAIHLGPRAARDAEWRRQVLRLFQNAKGWDHALVVD